MSIFDQFIFVSKWRVVKNWKSETLQNFLFFKEQIYILIKAFLCYLDM